MARKRESAVEQAQAEQPEAAPPAEKISKAEAVRRALAEGIEGPQDGVNFLKERFGIEISAQMFSSYKAQAKAKDAKKNGTASPVAKKAAPQPSVTNPADLARQVKQLVEQFGASAVVDMASVFAE